jgi:hypothetical protein
MRYLLVAVSLLLGTATSASAQLSVEIGVNIGIDVPAFPELVLVPGYPVYYDPRGDSNYFFYDGQYWVFWDDNWYTSDWYNGPWELVGPEVVPLFILRVPVTYYHRPPAYFRGWAADAPPRWGEHWGRGWEQRREGWDHWDRHAAPAPAPLPVYQRQYSGDRYPRKAEERQSLRAEHYRYQPREPVARQQARGKAPERQAEPRGAGHERQAQPEPAGRQRQAEPQGKPPERQAEPQGAGRERQAQPEPAGRQRQAEPQAKPPERQAPSRAGAPEHRTAQQGGGQAQQAAPKEQKRESKPPPKAEEKKEEHGQDHR